PDNLEGPVNGHGTQTRTGRSPNPGQGKGRKPARVAYGANRPTNRRSRAPMGRRLLSEHRLSTQQERDLERKGRISCASFHTVRHRNHRTRDGYGGNSASQAGHGSTG